MKVAVVGAGGWGKNHVRTWSSLGALALVCDFDADLRRAAEETHRVPTTPSFDEVLSSDVDGIVLATPAITHAELAIAALKAGKHVLVEKPMALSVGDAREMAEVARTHNRVLMVDHVLEYHPAVEKIHELARTGELGRLLYLSSHRLNFGRVRTDEDSLWSFAPHDLSMMTNLLGGLPTEVSCRGGAYLSENVSDVTLMHLEFPGGIKGYIFVSWLHPFKEHRFIVVGDRQMAVFDDTLPWDRKLQLYSHRVDWLDGQVPVAHRADAVPVPLEEAMPLTRAAEHFLASMASGDTPRTDAVNGAAVVELLEAGRRSINAKGATVMLPLQDAKAAGAYVHPTATVDEDAILGEGTKVWHHAHVMPRARIGRDVVLGQNCYVGSKAVIGDGVRIQNNVSVYDRVTLEDGVFVGPSAVFTNVVNPRSEIERKDEYSKTVVRKGASLGANCTLVCPIEIGTYAFVGAGTVATKNVPAHALVVGNPARQIGWMCSCATRLDEDLRCPACDNSYTEAGGGLVPA